MAISLAELRRSSISRVENASLLTLSLLDKQKWDAALNAEEVTALLNSHLTDGTMATASSINTVEDRIGTIETALSDVISQKGAANGIASLSASGKLDSTQVPISGPSTLGGVKIGSGLSIGSDGLLSVIYSYSLPIAGASTLGGIKVGTGLSADVNGVLSVASLPYDLVASVYGAPTESEDVMRFISCRFFTIYQNMAGSYARASVAPTGNCSFTLKKNNAAVAAINFTAGNAEGSFSIQSAIQFAAGDKFSLTAPAVADATLSDIDFAISAYI